MLEKIACFYILAVHLINGIDISNCFKIPDLTNLTKAKNYVITGRKFKGHEMNLIEPKTDSPVLEFIDKRVYKWTTS